MKTELKRYKNGEVSNIENYLSKANKQLLNDFLKKCSITAGDSKLAKIKRIILQFYDVTELPLDKQNKESIDSFLIVLNKSDKSEWSKNEIKVYLKKFILWHYNNPKLTENIKVKSKIEGKISENDLITDKELELMLKSTESIKEKAYISLAFETGARPQELLNLKWEDVCFNDTFANIKIFSKKTKQTREFPVKNSLNFLLSWKKNYPYDIQPKRDIIFCSNTRYKPLSSVGVNKMFRRISKKAGIKKDVWGYLFRHTRATKLYEELPQGIVEKVMGHKNMAGIYAHISNKKAREAVLNVMGKDDFPQDKQLIKRIEILEKQMKKIKDFVDSMV